MCKYLHTEVTLGDPQARSCPADANLIRMIILSDIVGSSSHQGIYLHVLSTRRARVLAVLWCAPNMQIDSLVRSCYEMYPGIE